MFFLNACNSTVPAPDCKPTNIIKIIDSGKCRQ